MKCGTKYVYTIILSIVLVLLTFNIDSKSNKVNAEDKVIRVGYPIVEDFTDLKDGIYSGYGYEYLREIAKFTGWKYEFVEVSLIESIKMLNEGKLDIVGGMRKNSFIEEYYDFPKYDAGSNYTTLTVLRSNIKISDSNYESMNGIKVGVYEIDDDSIGKFKKFCKDNNIKDGQIVMYNLDDGEELNRALSAGEVDAILGNDLIVKSDQRVALRFAPEPHYFITTKGNTDILDKLNYAISRIRELDPEYNKKLYQKYFYRDLQYTLSLTEEEKEYIKKLDTIRAVYIDNLQPVQNWNENKSEVEGIAVDVMKKIADDLDVNIKWIKANNYEQAFNSVIDGNADVFIGIQNEYNITDRYGLHITKPYIKLQTVGVSNKSKGDNYKVIAVPKSYEAEDGFLLEEKFDKVRVYDTLRECIEAVDKGIADFTFGNIYQISSETQVNYYNNINLVYEENDLGDIAIGVGEMSDIKLLSIINKSILDIQSDELNEILYNNVSKLEGKVGVSAFIHSNPYLVISIIVVVSAIIIILVYMILDLKLKNAKSLNKIFKEKAERDSLTGVYNCKSFENLATQYLLDKNDDIFSVFLILDIDNFKLVNDKLGHQVGDRVIKDLSTNLSNIFNSDDILGRLGGDEFEVLMTGINETNINIVYDKAKKLCEAMNKDVVSKNGLKVHVSLSVGICILKGKTTFLEMYEETDNTLYEVKRNGKNGYKIKIID